MVRIKSYKRKVKGKIISVKSHNRRKQDKIPSYEKRIYNTDQIKSLERSAMSRIIRIQDSNRKYKRLYDSVSYKTDKESKRLAREYSDRIKETGDVMTRSLTRHHRIRNILKDKSKHHPIGNKMTLREYKSFWNIY